MNRRKRMAGILAVTALVVVCAVLFLKVGGSRVEQAAVTKKAVKDTYTETGVLNFGRHYEMIAEVTGAVREFYVEENAKVKKGDLLLLIDSSDYEHEKEMAECTAEGYEAQLEESRIGRMMQSSPKEYLESIRQELTAQESAYKAAQTVYEASKVLYASGDISKVEMEQTEAEYQNRLLSMEQSKGRYEESSRVFSGLLDQGLSEDQVNDQFYESEEKQLTAMIAVQKHQIRQLEEKIEKCSITAPEGGVITDLPTKNLTMVQAGQTVVTMTGNGQAIVEADVLTNIAPYLHSGSQAEIVLKQRGKNVSIPGYVLEVYDFAKQGVSSLGLDEYRVHVIVKPEEDWDTKISAMDGYGVNVKFTLFDEPDCLTVPSDAVYQEDGESYVFLIEKNCAGKHAVKIRYQSAAECVIEEGLDEGDRVITQVDSEEIRDGMKVR